MRLGFDLDGVLAHFAIAFHQRLVDAHGDRCPKDYDPSQPPCWEWPRHFGYTQEEERACWDEVWDSRTFWQHLEVMPGEERTIHQLNALHVHDGHEIHFITHRRGRAVQYQSAWFLTNAGFRHPSVIIAGDKYPIINALKLDAYIDDRIETVNELVRAREAGALNGDPRLYLRHALYNQEHRHPGLIVVNNVWEMLTKEGLV